MAEVLVQGWEGLSWTVAVAVVVLELCPSAGIVLEGAETGLGWFGWDWLPGQVWQVGHGLRLDENHEEVSSVFPNSAFKLES